MSDTIRIVHPVKRGGTLRSTGETITTTPADAAHLVRTGRAVEASPVNRAIFGGGRPDADGPAFLAADDAD